MSVENSTIYALSSGRPPAAIAVVRISGPRAGAALETLTGRIPAPRQAALGKIRDAEGETIDEALVLWFPGPHSETGEDTAELQLHGGHAVIAAVMKALSRVGGLRPAEAGEFTRRAFENGKLDLTEVEGLSDLIAAETEIQRRQAFRQLKGLLGNQAEQWRARLIKALAMVEAPIDFSDEDDVPDDLRGPVLEIVRQLAFEIESAVAKAGTGERLRDGMVVAIAGPPNAGKSTLLNRIAGREAAIVSPYAGTTRDVIEVHLDLDGYPVTVLDTAGVRETTDPVEAEGVRRAQERAREADLVVWVVDASDQTHGGLERHATGLKNHDNMLIILNKIDKIKAKNETEFNNESIIINEFIFNNKDLVGVSRETVFATAASSGAGLDSVLSAIKEYAKTFFGASESSLVTRERHRHALEKTLEALIRALAPELAGHDDLLAEELRMAASTLGRLTGRIDVEDILDVVFRDFCIGK